MVLSISVAPVTTVIDSDNHVVKQWSLQSQHQCNKQGTCHRQPPPSRRLQLKKTTTTGECHHYNYCVTTSTGPTTASPTVKPVHIHRQRSVRRIQCFCNLGRRNCAFRQMLYHHLRRVYHHLHGCHYGHRSADTHHRRHLHSHLHR